MQEHPATDQQMASIRLLCERLGKQAPAPSAYAQAKALIATLTQEYRERKTSESAPSPAQAQDAPASREEVLHVFNRGVKAGWCKNTAESFAEKAGDVLERPILASSVASSFHRDELHMLELAIAAYAAQKEREQAAEVK